MGERVLFICFCFCFCFFFQFPSIKAQVPRKTEMISFRILQQGECSSMRDHVQEEGENSRFYKIRGSFREGGGADGCE